MPANKDLKRLVRARMTKTGESYSTARAHVLAASSEAAGAKGSAMRIEASTTGGRTITAFEVPLDYGPLLRGLGFGEGPEPTTFVWDIPADSPQWDTLAANWTTHGVGFVDQLAGVEDPDWEAALDWVAKTADAAGVSWFLLASASLAARGIDVRPGGVDIAVDPAGIDTFAGAVNGAVMQPIAPMPWPVSTHYGRLFFGAPIQVLGGPLDQSWPAPWDSEGQAQLETIDWRGHRIRATSLDRELDHARRMARYDHARAILRYRADQGALR